MIDNLSFHLDQKMAPDAQSTTKLQLNHAFRQSGPVAGGHIIIDHFEKTDAHCQFISLAPTVQQQNVTLRIEGEYRIQIPAAGGWLLLPKDSKNPTLWLPRKPTLRLLEPSGQITKEKDPEIISFQAGSSSSAITLTKDANWRLDWVYWRLPADIVEELEQPKPIELQPYHLWGSHTVVKSPADLYIHLINGWLYENRYSWPHNWKICSENDAHALFVLYCGLEKTTEKRLYSLLKQQLLLATIHRQESDGGWYHGTWTHDMESHYRLHCSGMHMLMDALSEQRDNRIRDSLHRAANYIVEQRTHIDAGTWFLHDSLEQSEERMHKSPMHWKPSNALGKTTTNTLILNTHLDTLIALDRYAQVTGDTSYEKHVVSGKEAALTILAMEPANWLYKMLFRAIYLTMLPTDVAKKLSLPVRAIKRISWKYIIPHLETVKKQFPRLVMPGGYIDRAIGIYGSELADPYQSINLMDLLRYSRRFPEDNMKPMIEQAMNFTHNSGILGYWAENSRKKYAIGFWIECLVHACTLYRNTEYRAWLAEAVQQLCDLKLGLPPSILGANAEILNPVKQHPTPRSTQEALQIINLNRGEKFEVIVVNPTKDTLDFTLSTVLPKNLVWKCSDGVKESNESPREISALEWIWGYSS